MPIARGEMITYRDFFGLAAIVIAVSTVFALFPHTIFSQEAVDSQMWVTTDRAERRNLSAINRHKIQ